MASNNTLKVGLAQLSLIWLNKQKTIEKIESYIVDAGTHGCDLVVFGEGLLPGYPFWMAFTNGAAWDDRVQKEMYAHYVRNSIEIEKGDLDSICSLAKTHNIAIYLGTIERASNRGGHSVYATLVYINKNGAIKSTHRKLQPTYDERLVWSPGDGNGLQTHSLPPFTVGGLNCWENWMPLPRTALYAMGENLHIAVWPGSERNTIDITRFIALEGRSYVISVGGMMYKKDIPTTTPHFDLLIKNAPDEMANGGSCIAGPNGKWIVQPQVGKEGLFVETLDFNRVLEERQNFDPVGHYSRPDVTKLLVNRDRQSVIGEF